MRRFAVIFSLLVILAVLVVSVACHTNLSVDSEGSASRIQWYKTLGGLNEDVGYSVQQTSDGGYIVAGCTGSTTNLIFDVLVIKTDAEGNKQWDKTLDKSAEDYARSVQQTSDGGYIIAGYITDSSVGWAVWLIKIDAQGNRQWDKTFGGSGTDSAYSVEQTSDGGYIICGSTSVNGDSDGWLIKTNSSGDKEWDKTFGGPNGDIFTSVQQTSDGGYIITGSTAPRGAGYDDLWLIKTNSMGNKQWDRTFGGSGGYGGALVQQTSDGGYIIAGQSFTVYERKWDAWLIKTDNSGNEQWDNTFGSPLDDRARSVKQTLDGGYIFAGSTGCYGDFANCDVWLVKTNSGGEKQWEETLGGSGSDVGTSLELTSDGGYIICGVTNSYGTGSVDVLLIKVKSEAQAAMPTPTATP